MISRSSFAYREVGLMSTGATKSPPEDLLAPHRQRRLSRCRVILDTIDGLTGEA